MGRWQQRRSVAWVTAPVNSRGAARWVCSKVRESAWRFTHDRDALHDAEYHPAGSERRSDAVVSGQQPTRSSRRHTTRVRMRRTAAEPVHRSAEYQPPSGRARNAMAKVDSEQMCLPRVERGEEQFCETTKRTGVDEES